MTDLRLVAPRRGAGFERPLVLDGWSPSSRWGYDAALECYWAELRSVSSPGEAGAAVLRVGPEHLVTTLAGLSRALGAMLGTSPDRPYLALTA